MATIKQKKAAQALVENGGSVGAAMRIAGYSDAMVKNPQKLTASRGFMEVFTEKIDDELLARRHLELLNKREIAHVYNEDEHGNVDVLTDQPDTQAVSKALDMAYKLKGAYAPDRSVAVQVTGTVKDFAEADAITAEYEQKLLEQYQSDGSTGQIDTRMDSSEPAQD